MDYNFTGDKLTGEDRLAVSNLEEILQDQRDGLHDAAWEIVALRRRLLTAGIIVPGGYIWENDMAEGI